MANANQIIPRSQQHGTIYTKPRDRHNNADNFLQQIAKIPSKCKATKWQWTTMDYLYKLMALQQISQNLQCTEIWFRFANQWLSDETSCTHVVRQRNKSWKGKLLSSYPAQLSYLDDSVICSNKSVPSQTQASRHLINTT